MENTEPNEEPTLDEKDHIGFLFELLANASGYDKDSQNYVFSEIVRAVKNEQINPLKMAAAMNFFTKVNKFLSDSEIFQDAVTAEYQKYVGAKNTGLSIMGVTAKLAKTGSTYHYDNSPAWVFLQGVLQEKTDLYLKSTIALIKEVEEDAQKMAAKSHDLTQKSKSIMYEPTGEVLQVCPAINTYKEKVSFTAK